MTSPFGTRTDGRGRPSLHRSAEACGFLAHNHKRSHSFVYLTKSVATTKSLFAAALLLFAAELSATERTLSMPDATLVDQNGQSVRLADLTKGKLVVMNFIFTSCTTVCSPMGANFAALQTKLGDRRDVALISVSIDPSTDTPAKLKAWSQRFKARSGWTLVTGPDRDVEQLLKALRVYSPNRFSHAPIALIGSDVSGRWERVSGLLEPGQMLRILDGLHPSAARREASTK